MGFDFEVVYKPGRQNTVADALSRRDEPAVSLCAITTPMFDWLRELRIANSMDPALDALRDQILSGDKTTPWALIDSIVTFKQRLYIPPASALLQTVLSMVHDDKHEGIQKTLHRLRREFHTPDDRCVVQEFVKACTVCQRNKTEHLHPAGLLLPLPVPSVVWSDVSMDFIEGFPRVEGKSVILTVVDRFYKCAHFITLSHPYSAESVAHAFYTDIVRLHGILTSIVSDRDSVFASAFWKALFTATGTKLHMSSVFHLQSDGQSEAINKVIAMYLRCLVGDRPRQWVKWLPWTEYVYNNSYHSALRETPFRVVCGRDPPQLREYEQGELRVVAMACTLQDWAAFDGISMVFGPCGPSLAFRLFFPF